MRMAAAISGKLTVQVDWLGVRVGNQPALSLHSSNEPGELSRWLCHDDSTINKYHLSYYYYKCIQSMIFPVATAYIFSVSEQYDFKINAQVFFRSCFEQMSLVWQFASPSL